MILVGEVALVVDIIFIVVLIDDLYVGAFIDAVDKLFLGVVWFFVVVFIVILLVVNKDISVDLDSVEDAVGKVVVVVVVVKVFSNSKIGYQLVP